ncbi:uncharacterized protein LOC134278778, partial [Saccostrea cucullata]|uniref:uncharacterized protein LOC134278778 n=1 Tax=Saccostrea cuccullata TaxID=36930 RepID=UPI002ED6AE65
MAEKRLPVFVGPGLPAFPQKRLRIDNSEISNVDRATQSVSSGIEHDSCIGETGNNVMREDSDDEDSYTEETDDDENQEDSDDEDSYTEETNDDEDHERCDDEDDADRSLLYYIVSSVYETERVYHDSDRIDLNSDDWYEKLTDIRQTYKMKHRSREEDVLAIKSMTKTSRLVKMEQTIVSCDIDSIGVEKDDRVYNCLTFNKNYLKFVKETPSEYLPICLELVPKIDEKILGSFAISDIVLKLGLKFLHLFPYNNKFKEKYDRGLDILNLPYAVNCMIWFDEPPYDSTFSDFKEYVDEIMKRENKSLQTLNLNSLLGSYLIGRDTGKELALDHLVLSHTKWSILVSILMSESYSLSLRSQWEERFTKLQSAFPLLTCESRIVEKDIAELTDIYKVLKKENNSVSFISDDVRHQVMSYFVKNCLITDEDYENYIKLSSLESLFEYVLPWWYVNYDEMYTWLDRYVFLPESLENLYCQRLGLDSLRHQMVEWNDSSLDRTETVKEVLRKNFNIPEEIFDWGYDARCRYIKCAKRGTKTVHRARAMIVGCAGAGKTTLLKRLQKLGLEELLKVRSTVGLEVHEDMFELDDDSSLRALSGSTDKDDKQILSVVDFGGQSAYYACHQVYLSKRAFYLLVIDMSKPFTEKVDENKCEQRGTMFADWTYGEYVLFWLKSIHTYCAEDTSVIIVATHSENATQK